MGVLGGEMFTKMGKFYTKTRRKLKKKHASSNFLSGIISIQVGYIRQATEVYISQKRVSNRAF
jgi:hypothetical protein